MLLASSSNQKLFSKFKGFKHLLGTLFTWKSHFEQAMCFYNASKIFGKSCDLELCFYEKDQSSKNCSGQNQWIIQVSLYFSEYILSKHLLYLFREYVHISLYIHRVKQFVASRGLGEAFVEFVKSLAPKSFKQKLEEKKADAAEQNRQRKTTQQEMPDKKKKLQQEM